MTNEDDRLSDFAKFDKVMGALLAVPYQELQEELAKDRKKKARKKRAKKVEIYRDSGGEADSP